MDLHTESVEYRGQQYQLREIPVATYLEILDEVQQATNTAAVMRAQVRLLEESVVDPEDFKSWPMAAIVGLGKLALLFHQRGGVDDDLKNSSNGRGGSTPSASAVN